VIEAQPCKKLLPGLELDCWLYLHKAKREERACLKARSEVEVLPPIINHWRESAVVRVWSTAVCLT